MLGYRLKTVSGLRNLCHWHRSPYWRYEPENSQRTRVCVFFIFSSRKEPNGIDLNIHTNARAHAHPCRAHTRSHARTQTQRTRTRAHTSVAQTDARMYACNHAHNITRTDARKHTHNTTQHLPTHPLTSRLDPGNTRSGTNEELKPKRMFGIVRRIYEDARHLVVWKTRRETAYSLGMFYHTVNHNVLSNLP